MSEPQDCRTFSKLAETLTYRVLLGVGKPLSAQDVDAIVEDESLLIAFTQHSDRSALERFGEKYHLPPTVAQEMLRRDLKEFTQLLQGGAGQMRVQTFKQRAIGRLRTHVMNHAAIAKLTKVWKLKRGAFHDVGCLFGLSMLAAVDVGYNTVHGSEISPNAFSVTKKIRELVELPEIDWRLYPGDFAEQDLPAGAYDLITVCNVFEHTPDTEAMIKQIRHVLADDGLCYILQGNSQSLAFVANEPHYRLPLLSLLPRDLAIKILLRLGKLKSSREYSIRQWPRLDKLRQLFKKHGLTAEFHQQNLGYYPTANMVDVSLPATFKAKIMTRTEEMLFPVLSPDEQKQVRKTADDYFEKAQQASGAESKMIYCKTVWEITVKKTAKGER